MWKNLLWIIVDWLDMKLGRELKSNEKAESFQSTFSLCLMLQDILNWTAPKSFAATHILGLETCWSLQNYSYVLTRHRFPVSTIHFKDEQWQNISRVYVCANICTNNNFLVRVCFWISLKALRTQSSRVPWVGEVSENGWNLVNKLILKVDILVSAPKDTFAPLDVPTWF